MAQKKCRRAGAWRTGAIALALAATSPYVSTSRAADLTERYPLRPLRVIIGFPPGGPVDIQARVIMQKLGDALQQSVVIDSRPGADGMTEVRERLSLLGLEPVGSTPGEHAAHLEAELARWTPVVKFAGLRID